VKVTEAGSTSQEPAAPSSPPKLETPDRTNVQTAAIAQFIIVVLGALGYQLTDDDRTTIAAVVAAGAAAFSAVLVLADAFIRRGRAKWLVAEPAKAAAAAKDAQAAGGAAQAAAAAAAGWNTAIPATGWWAIDEAGQKRPVAAWAFVHQGDDKGVRLAGLVKRGRSFGVAEDLEGFAGYIYELPGGGSTGGGDTISA
jgi:hypothetical protein